MKSFIIACLVLAVCAGFTAVLQLHVCDTVGKISEEVSGFDERLDANKAPEYIGCLDHALEMLRGRRWSVCLTVDHKEYEDIEEALLALRSAVSSGDVGNYSQSISYLKEKLYKLRASEMLTFEGIL